MTHPGRHGAAGFTLIEIIIAFAILALGLTLLLGTLSGATRHAWTLGGEPESAPDPCGVPRVAGAGPPGPRAGPWRRPTPASPHR